MALTPHHSPVAMVTGCSGDAGRCKAVASGGGVTFCGEKRMMAGSTETSDVPIVGSGVK